MSHNVYEFLYIVISSSISHAILIIALVYFVFNFIIINQTNKQIVDAFLDYLEPLKNETNTPQNTIRINVINKLIVSYINDKYADKIKSLNQQANIKDKLNQNYNDKYYNYIRIFLISMSIIFFSFLLFYYVGFRNYINFGNVVTEITVSFIIALILIVVYQYFFANYFVFKYIDYHFDTIITDKLKLSPIPIQIPIVKTKTKPTIKPVIKTITKPATNPTTKPATNPTTKPTTKPTTNPTTKPANATTTTSRPTSS